MRRSAALSTSTAKLRLDAREARAHVSRTLYGLFFEDLNFGCDGGLNANAVNNYSFDAVYVHRRPLADLTTILTHRPVRCLPDRLRHWNITGGALASSDQDAVVSGGRFGRVDAQGWTVLTNAGYPGDRPGIAARAGTAHLFGALVRRQDFAGDLEVRLVDGSGQLLASDRVPLPGDGWQQVAATLHPTHDALGVLELVFHGTGRVDLDEVVLVPADHWGAGDPRWSQGVLRRDLVETLSALRPAFVRFPGGCIVEGIGGDNAYQWKRTVGPLHQRVGDANLWGLRRTDGDYWQSMQVGFYEYFLLCEDLGAAAMPVVNAGLSCQGRSNECLALPSAEFDQLVQDILDLIDWATADPATNSWAALRAEAGHPEPFALDYLGIGNENFGPDYLARFDEIKAAVDAHRPGITAILSSGAAPSGKHFDNAWAHAREAAPDVYVDEHFYMPRKWVIRAATRYDEYPRHGPKAFLGEYAAAPPTLLPVQERLPANTFGSALAEAAFLTGVERNSDVVAMTCYAPLFALVENAQWFHNLIPFSPAEVLLTANYYVQQLFATTLGDRIVPVVDATLPDGVVASSTVTATHQYVKLVNTSARVVTVELDLPAAAAAPVRMTTLHAELKARNTLSFDGPATYQVRPIDSTLEINGGLLLLTLPRHSIVSLTAALAG